MRKSAWILLGIILASTCVVWPGCDNQKEKAQAAGPAAAEMVGPWRMQLKLSPNHPSMTKPVTFALHITDEHGRPVNDAQINGALTMKLMDMGVTKLTFASKGNGNYEAPPKSLDMSGPWNVAIEATQGNTHVNHSFDVVIYD